MRRLPYLQSYLSLRLAPDSIHQKRGRNSFTAVNYQNISIHQSGSKTLQMIPKPTPNHCAKKSIFGGLHALPRGNQLQQPTCNAQVFRAFTVIGIFCRCGLSSNTSHLNNTLNGKKTFQITVLNDLLLGGCTAFCSRIQTRNDAIGTRSAGNLQVFHAFTVTGYNPSCF